MINMNKSLWWTIDINNTVKYIFKDEFTKLDLHKTLKPNFFLSEWIPNSCRVNENYTGKKLDLSKFLLNWFNKI